MPDSVPDPAAAVRALHARVGAEITSPGGDGSCPATDAAIAAIRSRVARTTSGSLVGDYHLLERIARGGMSHVYLAERARDRVRVAIKILHRSLARHPEVVDRFCAEGGAARAARHGSVVEVLGDGTTLDGVPYLVMELLEGECLATLVDRGPLPIGAAAAIGAQLGDALAAVHGAGFVHCDLKPDNAFVVHRTGLGGWPAVKLLDFGVARRLGSGRLDSIVGTPPYMAPEQWRGGELDGRSDVYGLGCVLHEMLTGRPPFTAGSVAELSAAHRDAMPVAPGRSRAAIPEPMDRLVMRALSKDPSLRPTMATMASTLAEVAFGLPPGARIEAEPARQAG